jgi:hypothetical protein
MITMPRCDACKEQIGVSQQAMQSDGRAWHDTCFACSMCKNSLAGTSFFVGGDGDLFCKDDYIHLNAPSCDSCQLKITEGGVQTVVDGKDCTFHSECYLCCTCKEPFTGGQQVLTTSGKPRHHDCFVCANCGMTYDDVSVRLLQLHTLPFALLSLSPDAVFSRVFPPPLHSCRS